ncbi:putative adrenomedullin-5-like protein [Equus przewalskii]|uniref:Adrenomedullin-5-like protein n=1 Tax=Equus przewalskii TaxID=9798 RepID=A0ABM4QIM2_EQUPR|nr:putative adrenomedullin-5-like protein [Equus caballus]
MAAHILLLCLLASSVLGDPDSAGRRPGPQAPQPRGRPCSLGTCQAHRLPDILHWLRSASTKEPSAKAGREPQDPRSYGRRRRRGASVPLRLQDPSLRQRSQRRAQLAA